MNQQMNQQMTVKNWLVTLIVLAIPLVNIIMALVWGFENEATCAFVTRKRFCQAYLLMLAISIVLVILMSAYMGSVIFAAASQAAHGEY